MIASGISSSPIARPELAREAVVKAIANSGLEQVGSVILFLSSAFAFDPQQALREAARAAGTPQIYGCCSNGIFSNDDWILDGEGAVALVFPPNCGPQPLSTVNSTSQESDFKLAFCS